ncbi:transposase [Solimonas sp. K1W22B-7]|uniref:REP-associated tyrosine transposase n=1 Tax=Solimonas sp. K1W22B-7 TaxID=2303331 RepID=UPI000E32E8EB|nr:transposase [Solimonas sp. K1W22B-7]AXQ29935.1 transposase [Solimonas sp. K1W22B-7]
MSRYRRSHAAGASYFFTVALADRRSSALTDNIEKLREVYRKVGQRLPFETIAICILPDHVHAIWQLPEGDADFSQRWSQIKSGFSRHLEPGTRSLSKLVHRDKGIWQRRFWEHQIRDEEDLRRHAEYTYYNPVKHGLVRRVADWSYSSFQRDVKAGLFPADWAGDAGEESGFGEPP